MTSPAAATGPQTSSLIIGNALSIPKLIYGTAWKKERTADLVYAALKTGFRAVDTAAQPKHYDERGVGEGIGRAICEGIVNRKDLFIQTKFTPLNSQSETLPYDRFAPLVDMVHQSVQSSLKNFTFVGQEPYLDGLILHGPMDTIDDTMIVWKTLESYAPHRIRHLGLSNTTLSTLEAVYARASLKPAIVQNRFWSRTGFERALRSYCRENDMVFQAFWTITANRELLESEPVRFVAQNAGVDAVAAYYSLLVALGNLAVLDGTTDTAHMAADLEIEKVGLWADNENRAWSQTLKTFQAMLGDL
ncbi:aldo-keto reductase (AKR) [Purpureocillium lilacinum]|uniref:Aldo-keto reductase (AKR) n=1 Tax=Purpureocillium lilacinum TaxID=33203 RepID=A0A179HGG9_PURLI|nr:aldo-keto reductase (AKR) [Purpureocillium lilacinum]KAK4095185.1 hypothetical protein Purlil1_881 [Purpureocillium lilacinum]OAQ88559.1 aldo-keto reductase (AKR) [Purpureocillium lilacinum]PWI73897.1 hypothetical protein PCL_09173 [Purpureocillium lilacinum]GJN74292.1 hypothetical protein PLICBS_008383 [Purpureocillium lilacinum]GJN84809.1 hypothetical protein PLIIFM63780_008373 [Purpureocillium lilacinum]